MKNYTFHMNINNNNNINQYITNDENQKLKGGFKVTTLDDDNLQ